MKFILILILSFILFCLYGMLFSIIDLTFENNKLNNSYDSLKKQNDSLIKVINEK